jgi:protein phosphatase
VALDDDILLHTPEAFPPATALVEVEFAARSWRSPLSVVNSDHYFVVRLARTQELLLSSLPPESMVQRFAEYAYGIVVADGMGPQGELASRLAVAVLLRLAMKYGRWQLRIDDEVAKEIVERLFTYYRDVDGALLAMARDTVGEPLRSTLTAFVSSGRDVFVAHVGHSRAYLLRDGVLLQLTSDHSQRMANTSEAVKVLRMSDAAQDFQHVLSDALGVEAVEPHVDVERLTLENGDIVLLATNGITDVLRDGDIALLLASPRTIEQKAEALMAMAVERGTTDDATVVLGEYVIPT